LASDEREHFDHGATPSLPTKNQGPLRTGQARDAIPAYRDARISNEARMAAPWIQSYQGLEAVRKMSTLPPSPFMNSAMPTAESAVPSDLPPVIGGTAAPFRSNCPYCDGTGDVHTIDGEWRGTCDCNEFPQDQEPTSSTGGPQEAPAGSAPPNNTAAPAGASNWCLTEADDALYWQLRHADNPFERDLPELPDVHAFFDEIEPTPSFLGRSIR
jgi:hypothetical protein